MHLSPTIQFALDAVARSAALVRQIQKEMISPALTKDDRSPVTVGDFAAQAVVAKILADSFPGDVLVGEENAGALRDSGSRELLAQVTGFVRREFSGASEDDVCQWIDRGAAEPGERFWTLDPIDGTKGFLRGEQYAVALAFVVDGRAELGVLGCPNLSPNGDADVGGPGAIFVAMRDEGAWARSLNSEDEFARIRVSPRNSPADARLLRSVEASHTDGGKIDELCEAIGVAADPVRMDSQAKYAVLAIGGGEVILRLLSPSRPDYREKIWDQAAGSILVEEAGGRVTDLDGRPLDFTQGRTLANNRGVLVTNGHLHEALLSGLKQVGA